MGGPLRHQDSGRHNEAFNNDFLVKCPKCNAPAKISDGRFACSSCHHSAYKASADPNSDQYNQYGFHLTGMANNAWPIDPVFGCELLLIRPVKQGHIFARNVEQLEVLRAFVAASHRERTHLVGWANNTYISRLPAWIKSAKNRDEIVKACDQLLRYAQKLN